MDYFDQSVFLAASTIRLATPLVLAALAGLFAERSGVVDIGLEGKMLAAAFAAAALTAISGSHLLGLAGAIVTSMMLALVHGYATITHRGDQVVSGMAINITVAGLGPTLAEAWFGQAGRISLPPGRGRFMPIELPFAAGVRDIPIVGLVYTDIISGQNLLTYIAVLTIPLAVWVLYCTRFGLRLRAVGENPAAVDTAGISVASLRYRALLMTGLLCGIAGAYLSIAQSEGFTRDMTAGKGYLALAALIFGKWRPVPAVLACLLFAFTDALQARLQGVSLPGIGSVPTQLVQALPYVLTIILLAGFVGRAVAPRAVGKPYVKER
ncbi:nucleoside ABC transporter membrane protein [Arboricoccus pini]|uniref:Nucleoside ABC transporter membrane protein n=1 Tax=Arboricoccus pini TaxID=1963835 RepID=A0A212QTB3_9PROT|nr:ABC transporter permease [Arboricoccus pini]SNB62879.1 nucleoside ABC transporter membrane protein [Arboricoccus pini]